LRFERPLADFSHITESGAPLWALNELRRQGIHHCLITIGHGATGIGPTIVRAGPTGSVGLNLPVWKRPDDQPVILTAKGSGNQYNVTLMLDVCLAEIDGFERQAILPFLYQCAKRVTGIVRHFDLTFFSKT